MPAPEYLVAERLMPFPEIEKIVLFGSRARGDAMPRSDIDLAVACPRADAKVWSDIVEAAEEAPTLLRIDLVRMETAPPELLAEIAREGRVLYEPAAARRRVWARQTRCTRVGVSALRIDGKVRSRPQRVS
ncbi:MAG TPA: nucleotidyltransferase domain-containing protein [Rhizomicrobium sp.]|jgi:predicted nucleotidyltransferase|nr:nucleotidyltransferase domain-containing protein [Rhizomicrobium sp.]